MKNILYIVVFVFEFFILNCFGQNKKIDSLQFFLNTAEEDTSKVNTLNLLAQQYISSQAYPKTDSCVQEATKLAEKLNFKKGLANSFSTIGVSFFKQDNYPDALKNHLAALKIRKELNDKTGVSVSYSSIGGIYREQGDYPNALDCLFNSLKIKEELGNKNSIAKTFVQIGFAYDDQGDHTKALDYYLKALKISEELGDKALQENAIGHMGIAYSYQAEINPNSSKKEEFFNKALNSYFKALKLAQEVGNKSGIANNVGNIGAAFKEMATSSFTPLSVNSTGKATRGELQSKALVYFLKALKLDKELENENGVAIWLSNIGSLYIETGKFKEAEQYIKRAIALDSTLGVVNGLRLDEEALSHLYDITGRHKEALIHFKKSMALKDSLFNLENKKQLVQKEMNYEFEKKEAITKAENEKIQAIAEEKNRRQEIITLSVAFGLLLMLLFAGFIFRSLRITRKQKQIIEIKNSETELQKRIIEEKNKDITDSIHYAKRIQDALLRDEEHTSMHLPEHFILFLPKDIVSGDFYWGAEKQGYWYFAAVDCTGHGVPGAVMSMLGISFLNDIISLEQALSPAEILNRLRDRVVSELRQTGESGGSKDGMDISLCRLDMKTNALQWAGANNSLNLIQNGQLGIVKADKQPIGYHPNSHPFTNREIQLQKGDSIYLYSDGYADQFGGAKGKKFKYKQLDELIIAYKLLPMNEQKKMLKKHFVEWKGLLEQVDDVCVFGVRV